MVPKVLVLVSWVQRGVDIDGEAAGDQAGYSIYISSDGWEVAVGAVENAGNGVYSGHARVFIYKDQSFQSRMRWGLFLNSVVEWRQQGK